MERPAAQRGHGSARWHPAGVDLEASRRPDAGSIGKGRYEGDEPAKGEQSGNAQRNRASGNRRAGLAKAPLRPSWKRTWNAKVWDDRPAVGHAPDQRAATDMTTIELNRPALIAPPPACGPKDRSHELNHAAKDNIDRREAAQLDRPGKPLGHAFGPVPESAEAAGDKPAAAQCSSQGDDVWPLTFAGTRRGLARSARSAFDAMEIPSG